MLTASVRVLTNLALALRALDFDAEQVFVRCGIAWQDIVGQDGDERRVPVELLDRFWAAAVEVTGDPAIGVRIGALARLSATGVLGDVVRTSATFGDAVLKTTRYMRVWNEAARFSLLIDGDRAIAWYRPVAAARRHAASSDAVMARIIVLSRELTGIHLIPKEVLLARAAPPETACYREVFGILPTFDQSDCALVFDPNVLTLPIKTSDSDSRDALTRHAEELMDALPVDASLKSQVQRVLANELRGGNPMIDNVAAKLSMHPKTLRRRLKEEGTTHSDLLEALRRELAERYLGAPDLNVTEVAFLLGYSDASAFNKAFRRWFEVPPLTYRQRLRHRS
jgi:AraC-like DNA-binding protein